MTPSRIRHGIALAAAATVAATGIGLAPTSLAPAAHAASTGIRVAQHNTDQDPARWGRLVRIAESGNWDAVLAQEVCQGWMDALRTKHPGWTISWHSQVAKADCPGGSKGNVAIHPGSGSRWAEPFDVAGEGKNFGMACAVFSKGGHRVHACSTHFTVYDADAATVRLRQARKVKEWTQGWTGQGHAVVLGGDLNTSPKSMELDPLYKNPAGTSNGAFNEAVQLKTGSTQRSGAEPHWTVSGRKIDYLFFTANHTPMSAGGSLSYEEPTPGAHKILKATTTLH